ncbi:MerR family transcriptional regulator [Fluoribacter gormanii]|uniref:Mercuric resistance operon regulatory protein n=1 Tax=Fluoribacter gormanii TaxID=464 RepID=A0A377GJQ4_9GAMM|nr:MerR family transcriptional regulator [Fluoribacter gormanii]KTD00898.1 MerR family transcriptional regulator [Fluoribacter gormanii]SIR49281.1 MerR family transcriptional regulator, mercuric resistance operon regulatory protein [Fluoribacter gormanii]STO24803.1 Mercuric resistance operon regulatory protein [Fluoribacter gormanii]
MSYKTIGEFAKLCEVGVETIRYYQRKGLIHVPLLPKELGAPKIRRYGDNDISRLRFILLAKKAGFTLKEIKELLEFDAKNDRKHVRDMAEKRIEQLNLKINELTEACSTLSRLVAKCRDTESSPCPILMTFEKSETGN